MKAPPKLFQEYHQHQLMKDSVVATFPSVLLNCKPVAGALELDYRRHKKKITRYHIHPPLDESTFASTFTSTASTSGMRKEKGERRKEKRELARHPERHFI